MHTQTKRGLLFRAVHARVKTTVHCITAEIFYQEHCCRRFNYQKQMEDRNESLKECNILPQTSALAEAVNVMSSDIFIQRAVLDDPIPIRRWKIMLAIRKVLK